MKSELTLGNITYDLTNRKDLLELLTRFTDGVYNSSDTASFTDEEVKALNVIRDYYSEIGIE